MYELNYLAILVAAVVSFFVGWAWFSPMLFMKQWVALAGMSPEKMEGGKQKMIQSMVLMFICSFITAYVLGYFVLMLNVTGIIGALRLGFWLWLGFYATTHLGPYLWEGKPLKLSVLQGGQTLVCVLAMTIILALWQ